MKKDLNTKQIKWLNDVYELNRMIGSIDIDPSRTSHIKPLDASIITYIEFMLKKGGYDDDEFNSNDIGVINFIKDWYRSAREAYPNIKIDNTDQQYNRPYLNKTRGMGIDIVNNDVTFIDNITT